MQNVYKQRIIDFVEGRQNPAEFLSWIEGNNQVFDWLQSFVPAEETAQVVVDQKFEYYLKKLSDKFQKRFNKAHNNLCIAVKNNKRNVVKKAKQVALLQCKVDVQRAGLTNSYKLLVSNVCKVLCSPSNYKADYVQHLVDSLCKLDTTFYGTAIVPYVVKDQFESINASGKLWLYVSKQRFFENFFKKYLPEEKLVRDVTIENKASFILDVCPDYIGGEEVEKFDIIQSIVEEVPEDMSATARKKKIRELIKQQFYVVGQKYPRWVQDADWPVSPSGKPMRFVKQQKDESKGDFYTIYTFEDVDTGDVRTVEQFT